MSCLYAVIQRRLFALAALLLCAASLAVAQTNTADIVGTVTDATGAVIPNAKVTVTNTGTGQTRSAESNSVGDYAFSLLQVGSYSVKVEAAGFRQFLVSSVTVAAGDRARVDAQLQPGVASESVTVTSVSPALQTDNSTVGTLVDNTQVQDLPLNGRNFINLVQVQAGIVPGLGGSFGSGVKPDDRRETSSYSANGQTDQANNNMIDGFDNNDRMIGVIGVRPSPDAIDQVKVETGLYTAEIGRSAGGVVDIITKAGTNAFHGSVYEYFRNDKLDASDYFAVVKTELRQNQFGGSLGGPIRRNKTFFFGDYEGFRQVSGQTATSLVPTLYEEQHCSLASGCDFTDITVTPYGGSPGPGPFVPAAKIDPVGLAYFQLYPKPNVSGQAYNYSYSPNKTQFSNLFDVRIDQHFSDKTSFFGRYSFNNVNTFVPGPLPPVNGVWPGGGLFVFSGPSAEREMHLGLILDHVFNPNLLGELKAGYLRNHITSLIANHGLTPATSFGYTGVNIAGLWQTDGLPAFILGGGYRGLGDSEFQPELELDNSFQYAGSLIYTRGKHSIKVGGGIIRRQAMNLTSTSARGSGYILGTITGNSVADMVEGEASSVQRQYSLFPSNMRAWEFSGYAQDNWHATRALTLNLGVRYDVFTPYTERNNLISNFDFTTDLIVSPSLSGANASSATAGMKTYYGDIAPRIGFALDLGHKTVVRGGFGISYFPGNFTEQAFLKSAPFDTSFHCGIVTDSTPCTGVYAGIVNPYVGTNYYIGSLPVPTYDVTTATNPAKYAGTQINAMDFNMRPSYVEQYSLGIQKDVAGNVVGINYVGNLGRRLVGYPNLNQVPYEGASTPIASLPTTIIPTGVSAGVSNYNALQLTLERRLAKGLTGNINYSFAHGLSDISTNGEGAQSLPGGAQGDHFTCIGLCHVSTGSTSASSYKVVNSWERYDYGNAETDVRHRVAVTLGYDLPFASKLTGVQGALLKGWSTNVLYYYQTGLPFTVQNEYSEGGTASDVTSNDRPNVVGDIKPAHRSIQEWFNTAAFQTQPDGLLGDEGKNPIYAPRATALNFSVFKTFAIREDLKLQFRSEFFNLLNTPSFDAPDNYLGDSTFGVIGYTLSGATPRQIQFAAKLLF